jgi:hypothetical protein
MHLLLLKYLAQGAYLVQWAYLVSGAYLAQGYVSILTELISRATGGSIILENEKVGNMEYLTLSKTH